MVAVAAEFLDWDLEEAGIGDFCNKFREAVAENQKQQV